MGNVIFCMILIETKGDQEIRIYPPGHDIYFNNIISYALVITVFTERLGSKVYMGCLGHKFQAFKKNDWEEVLKMGLLLRISCKYYCDAHLW